MMRQTSPPLKILNRLSFSRHSFYRRYPHVHPAGNNTIMPVMPKQRSLQILQSAQETDRKGSVAQHELKASESD